MISPLHVGVEHPNLLWVGAAGLVAFVAGLAVNLYRSTRDAAPTESPAPDDAE
ncbi:hypothetical protein [Halorussus marinus]|uniref:hypothetical protein n=1 Tax=Halorussus marinus TaxID=2505976 RepID=UPI001430F927|nr:hypothetical protein [Halorussus marinus]